MITKACDSINIFVTEKNTDILNPISWHNKIKLENLASRVETCKYMEWASVICKSCESIQKPSAVKLSCMSPYCQDQQCIKNRIRVFWNIMNKLNIRSRNMFHFIIGFPDIKRFTPEIRKSHNRKLAFITENMKRLGTPLKMIRQRDIAISKSKPNHIFVHYHCAQLPMKDVRKFMQNLKLIQSRASFPYITRIAYYRRTEGLFNYFSKRSAGMFGNIKKGESYGYPDITKDIIQYFYDFYNTRALALIGLRRPEGSSNVPRMLNDSPHFCTQCGNNSFKLVPNSIIELNPAQFRKPPTPPATLQRDLGLLP